MGWVVCSEAVLESRDTVLIIVVTASRCICDAVSSHCREILEQCDGTVSGIMGDEIGEGTIEGAGEMGSELDGHSGVIGGVEHCMVVVG
ncbi:hypothetical protein Tco_1386661 [Tanacetum coccineum]